MSKRQKGFSAAKSKQYSNAVGKTGGGAFECVFFEKIQAAGLMKQCLNMIRTMRFRDVNSEEIVKALNKAFFFMGEKLTVDQFTRSLPVYPQLAAAYIYGRDESVGMLTKYITDTIEQSEKNEKTARLAMDFLERIDDGAVIKAPGTNESITLTTTGQTLGAVMQALNEVTEPEVPDETYLEFREDTDEDDDDITAEDILTLADEEDAEE
jgi:hypothetical protein